jgi:hypothetical protein
VPAKSVALARAPLRRCDTPCDTGGCDMTGRVQAWVTVAIALAMTEAVLQRRGALMAFTHQRGRNDPRRNAARGA